MFLALISSAQQDLQYEHLDSSAYISYRWLKTEHQGAFQTPWSIESRDMRSKHASRSLEPEQAGNLDSWKKVLARGLGFLGLVNFDGRFEF